MGDLGTFTELLNKTFVEREGDVTGEVVGAKVMTTRGREGISRLE